MKQFLSMIAAGILVFSAVSASAQSKFNSVQITDGSNTVTLNPPTGGSATYDFPATGGTILTNPMSNAGEIIYGGASGAPTALAAGTSGFILQSGGAGAPSWTATPSLTSLTAATVYGGTANGSTLTLRSTSSGTPSGDEILLNANASTIMSVTGARVAITGTSNRPTDFGTTSGIYAGSDASNNFGVEMFTSGGTPYIDFTTTNTTDYDYRFILSSATNFGITGDNAANITLALTNSGAGNMNFTADGSVTGGTGVAATTGNVAIAAGDLTLNGTTRISNAGAATLTGLTSTGNVTISGAQVLGASPVVFEGSTDDDVTTTIAVADPSANQTITLPNSSGTTALVQSGGHLIQSGTATLAAGSVTVNGVNVRASSVILVSVHTPGGTQGFLSTATRVNSTDENDADGSFDIDSTDGTETSTVDWMIIY